MGFKFCRLASPLLGFLSPTRYRTLFSRINFVFPLAFIMGSGICSAHMDFGVTRDFGNIKIGITTGYRYEEVEKVFLFGPQIEDLAKRKGFNGQIFFDFQHIYIPRYINDAGPNKISFNRDSVTAKPYFVHPFDNLVPGDFVGIRMIATKFNVREALKMLEFAIDSLERLKDGAKRGYCGDLCFQKKLKMVIPVSREQLDAYSVSRAIDSAMLIPVSRSEEFKGSAINYYLQSGRYHFVSSQIENGKPFLVTDEVYEFKPFNLYSGIVFDSDSTFTMIAYNGVTKRWTSRKQYFQRDTIGFQPLLVSKVSRNKISISFPSRLIYPGIGDRTLLYFIDRDSLILDLDSAILHK